MNRVRSGVFLGLVALGIASIASAQQPAGPPGSGRQFFGGMMGRGGGLDHLTVANDPAVQTKLGIAEKKSQLETLATEARTARREAFTGVDFRKIRDMAEKERTALFEKMGKAREKVEDDTLNKLKESLGVTIFKQLDETRAGLLLTRTGPTGVLDKYTALILNLTDDQKRRIKVVVDKYRSDRMELFQGFRRGQRGPGGNAGGPRVGPQVIFVAAERPPRPDFDKIRAKMDELQKAANKAIGEILTEDQKTKIKALMAAVKDIKLQRRQFGPGGRRQGGRRPGGGGPPQ